MVWGSGEEHVAGGIVVVQTDEVVVKRDETWADVVVKPIRPIASSEVEKEYMTNDCGAIGRSNERESRIFQSARREGLLMNYVEGLRS